MINYFIGKEQTWLETQLRQAQDDFAAGLTVTSAGAGDATMGGTIEVPVKERIEQLLYALFLLDPDNYPASAIRRVTRTRVQVYTPLP